MGNVILLVKAMLKGNGLADLAGDRTKKRKNSKKSRGIGSLIMLAFAGLYMGGLAMIGTYNGYSMLQPLGMQSLILGLVISGVSFLVFFFGLFYVMSVFYFSKDIEKLLPLPVTPGELLMAKFLVTLVYEYLVTLVLLAPTMITYGILGGSGVLYYLYMIITLLLLPIVPLVIASLIVILIMRFSPAARNKDRFTMVAGILALVVGLGGNFGLQSIFRNVDSKDFAAILSRGADSITKVFSSIFPGTYFASYAMAKPEGWDSFGMMVLFVAVAAIAGGVLYVVGNLLYFKGVLGIASSASKGKKLTGVEFAESTMSGSAFVTYIKKDIRVLLRTPIFFMNNILITFLMPLIILFPALMDTSSSDLNLKALLDTAKTTLFTGDLRMASFILAGFFGLITITCGVNGISESAISREGNCAYLMKIIPMSYRDQIWAKISVGVGLSTLAAILLLIILTVLLTPPFWFILLCLAIIPGAVLFPNITGIIFDLYMPKIKWDNEQKAVKQNMNVLYGMVVAFLMVAIVAGSIAYFSFPFWASAVFAIFLPLLMASGSALFVNKIVDKTMLQLAA